MKYKTEIFGKGAGEMIVIPEGDILVSRLETITIGGVELAPGAMTTLNDYFTAPMMYCGLVNENTMLFLAGIDNGKKYYYARHYLTETRFFCMYSYIAGRDFNFKNGKWK